VIVDPVLSGVSEIRVVLVQRDSDGGTLSILREGRAPAAFPDLPATAQRLYGLDEETDLGLEILRLRACSEMCSGCLAPHNRWLCGGHLPCRTIGRLDKHGLDVALSAGRHAAERAKLAGVTRLIGLAPSVMAPSVMASAECWRRTRGASSRQVAHELSCLDRRFPEPPVRFDPYDALRCRGYPEIAALVGAAIAAAQMGIPFGLPDPAGAVAIDAALAMNPGVRAWLDPLPAESPALVLAPGRSCSRCDV
jgi:nicotinate-nucleotide--dimethylbenzimidazole phosphoribosyltransferase